MTARERYDAMIRDAVWPPLRERGFKRAKNTFRHRTEASWEVVNFQSSQSSVSDHVKFAVNLGIDLDVLRPPAWRDKLPRESMCQVRDRLEGPAGDWWVADARTTDFARLGAELVAALLERGLPWLEARASPERLRDLWLSELEVLKPLNLGYLPPLVEAIGPESARVAVAAEQERRSHEEVRAEIDRIWGEEDRRHREEAG
jgi:hypothetical protein